MLSRHGFNNPGAVSSDGTHVWVASYGVIRSRG
jgi:hypothetical protein